MTEEKKIRLLVTGANGFIGRNFCDYMKAVFPQKYVIYSPRHKELDLTDEAAVETYINENEIKQVLHCANRGGTRKTGYDSGENSILDENIRMFMALHRCLSKLDKFIMLGSGAEYDRAHYTPMMSEEMFGRHIPKDPYGFSKYICSNLAMAGNKIIILRIFGMFGPHEDYSFKFISNAIVKNLMGLPIIINQNVNFDFMYIQDGVKLIQKVLDGSPTCRTYNLTTGKTVDLITIAKTICEVTGIKSEIVIRNPGLNVEYSGNNSRLMLEFPHKFMSLQDSIKDLVLHFQKILPEIDKKTIMDDSYINSCKTKNGNEDIK